MHYERQPGARDTSRVYRVQKVDSRPRYPNLVWDYCAYQGFNPTYASAGEIARNVCSRGYRGHGNREEPLLDQYQWQQQQWPQGGVQPMILPVL